MRVPLKSTRGTRPEMQPRVARRRTRLATAASPAFGGAGPGGATAPGSSGPPGRGGSGGSGIGGEGPSGQRMIVLIESSSVTVDPAVVPATVPVLSILVGSQASPPEAVPFKQR